jgi:mono/diheme cytochrome c family protein
MLHYKQLLRTAILLIVGCSSFDLGKEDPDSFSVNTTEPTWAADVQPVLLAKCANCHTNNKSQFVPSNVPSSATLNNITDKTTFDNSLALSVKLRVFGTPSNPMPPNFATPLTSNERAALKKYIDLNVVSPLVTHCTTVSTTTKTYADVSAVFQFSCAGCHTAGGEYEALKLTTLDEIKAARESVLDRMGEKTMPPTRDAFDDSAERTNAIEWLCAGSDLN